MEKCFLKIQQSQEAKINSKKGVIENINEKKKSYPAEIKKIKIKINDLEKKIDQQKKLIINKNLLKRTKIT